MFSLATWPFREDLKKDLLGTLRKIKELGFDGVELTGGLKYPPLLLKNALEETHLALVGWHIFSLDLLAEDLLFATILYMNTVSNHMIVIPNLPDEMTNTSTAWVNTAALFNSVAKCLQAYNISLSYHNHAFEFTRLDSKYLFDSFCNNISENVYLQADTGNILSAGASPEHFIELYKKKIRTIHIKPYSLITGFSSNIDSGDIDFNQIINSCIAGGIEEYIIEYEGSGDSYEKASECLCSIKQIYQKLDSDSK